MLKKIQRFSFYCWQLACCRAHSPTTVAVSRGHAPSLLTLSAAPVPPAAPPAAARAKRSAPPARSGLCVSCCPLTLLMIGAVVFFLFLFLFFFFFCSFFEHTLNGVKTGRCVRSCRPGEYPDSATSCRSCAVTCFLCKGPEITDCLQCDTPSPLYLTPNGSCSARCPDNFYQVSGAAIFRGLRAKDRTGSRAHA